MSSETEAPAFQLPEPGNEHKLLEPFAGTFKSIVRLWMGPGDPQVSTGTMTNSFQLRDLFLHQDYVGDAVDGPFPNFCGKGYWGYNQTKQQYEGFWIDNATTTMQVEMGQVDDTGKTWTMHSEVLFPGMDQPLKKRTLIILVDQDHHRMESYVTGPDGNEFKNMEIEYERAK